MCFYGRVTAMAEAFNDFGSEALLYLASSTGRGGGFYTRCKASREIHKAAMNVIYSRARSQSK